MTARVWPVDAVTGAPSYTGRALRQTQVAPLVAGATTARPLGSLSGVRPGTASNIVTATGTTWTVTPFAGIIDGEALAIAGPYQYAFDANVTGSVTAAAGSARVDRLDVQVSDPAESDGSSVPSIAIVKNDGAPGSGVPVAAPARSHALAYINVPASGGGSPTITWVAPYVSAPGGLLYCNTFSQLPATANLADKCQAYDTGFVYRWNGSAWKPWESDWNSYTATLVNFTIGTGGAALNSTDYRWDLGRLRIRFRLYQGTSGQSVGAGITVTIPSGVTLRTPSTANLFIDGGATLFDVGVAVYKGWVRYNSTDTDKFAILSNAATVNGSQTITSTVPWTWGAGDGIEGELIADVV